MFCYGLLFLVDDSISISTTTPYATLAPTVFVCISNLTSKSFIVHQPLNLSPHIHRQPQRKQEQTRPVKNIHSLLRDLVSYPQTRIVTQTIEYKVLEKHIHGEYFVGLRRIKTVKAVAKGGEDVDHYDAMQERAEGCDGAVFEGIAEEERAENAEEGCRGNKEETEFGLTVQVVQVNCWQ